MRGINSALLQILNIDKVSLFKGGENTMPSNSSSTVKPGQEATRDMKLYVKDADGNTLGEISVPAGHRVPPTRIEGAESYSTKK